LFVKVLSPHKIHSYQNQHTSPFRARLLIAITSNVSEQMLLPYDGECQPEWALRDRRKVLRRNTNPC